MKPQVQVLFQILTTTLVLAIILPSIVLVNAESTCCEDYCYSADADKTQVSRYSTKTPYQVAKGAQTNNDYYVPSKYIDH